VGIPLLGDTPMLHDELMGAKGAFEEAILGIHHLLSTGSKVEIRVVLQGPLMERLPEIARFIFWSVPNVSHVAFMGLEPIGYAKRNAGMLRVHLSQHADRLRSAVRFLSDRGVRTSIYNAPLCVLPPDLRPFARRSISDWKQTYIEACDGCQMKAECSGFFEWISPSWLDPAVGPIQQGSKESRYAAHSS
jgi:His-Xaa-Ser system radical SAM maturase HxsC